MEPKSDSRPDRAEQGVDSDAHTSDTRSEPVAGQSADVRVSRIPLRRRSDHRPNGMDLIVALEDAASAIAKATNIEDVLGVVVGQAKTVTNTDKAIVALVGEDFSIEGESIAVRGRLDEHPESWWREKLDGIASDVLAGNAQLGLDRQREAWLLCVPVRVSERPLGLLCAINSKDNVFTEDEVSFAVVLATLAAAAIENARLAEHTRYAMLAGERARIAREMHDGLSQSLFSVALGLEVVRKQIAGDPTQASFRLEQLSETLAASMNELRRHIQDLRPVRLVELGLSGAIRAWVEEMSDSGLEGAYELVGELREVPPDVEVCIYSVAREAITNVVRHSLASHMWVRLTYTAQTLEVDVEDDGIGIDLGEAADKAERGSAFGMRSMQERVDHQGGSMTVSCREGAGTWLHAHVPVRGHVN